jgi:hypothetical protein
MLVFPYYAQVLFVCLNFFFVKSVVSGWAILFMLFGLKIILFFKCKNYFVIEQFSKEYLVYVEGFNR